MSVADLNLRDRLRSGTRHAQDALDAAGRRFALDTSDGLRRFLASERDAISTLARAGLPDAGPVLDRLDHDLEILGHADPVERRPTPRADDVTARSFVWHSGRLALRMTARAVPDSAAARAYLNMPRDVAAWRALCEILEQMPGYGAAADRTLTAANDWLALFETVRHDHAGR